jgi:AcrR family transcriptional regulator
MPISDCEVRDPRIRRTRQLLQGALRGLMHSRSFEEISVQDIAEAATVNRATFYDHYTDKFALLEALIGGGFHQLLHERNVEFSPDSPEVASAIILAACDYQVLMHQGSGGCKGDSPFEPLIDAAITNAMRRVLVRDIENLGVVSSFHRELLASAASAAIHAAAKQWFRTPNRPTVEEVVPQIAALILPIFERAAVLAEIRPAIASSARPLP